MDLEDLIERVGEEGFALARDWAWETAAGTGHGPCQYPQVVWDIWDDLAKLIWYPDGTAEPWAERLSLLFTLYRQMPCFSILHWADSFPERSVGPGSRTPSLTAPAPRPTSDLWSRSASCRLGRVPGALRDWDHAPRTRSATRTWP